MVSILDDAQRSCLTRCCSPDTNTHVIQCLSSNSPTSRARRFKSTKNLSTVSFCCDRCTINWSNALNAAVAYGVIRSFFISSGSALCSLLSCWYTSRGPPHRQSSKTCSTVHSAEFADQLHILYPFENRIVCCSQISNALPASLRNDECRNSL